MLVAPTPSWGLILAGGDGTRLQPLTRQITGDARPKQFCPILGGETLLDRTRRRVELLVRWDRQVVIVTRTHAAYARHLERELAPGRLAIQPENRGTGPGILYPVLKIRELAGNVPLAIFPSDHAVSDDAAFMAHVESAVTAVHHRPDLIVLLGIEATRPESDYGWIEASEVPLPFDGEPVFPIVRFWEKPSPRVARLLLDGGGLWNSFVMVGWVSTFVDLVQRTAPELMAAFEPLGRLVGRDEATVLNQIYRRLPTANFSEQVLAASANRLATVRVKGVDWTDLGNPDRLLELLRRHGREPAWLSSAGLASTA